MNDGKTATNYANYTDEQFYSCEFVKLTACSFLGPSLLGYGALSRDTAEGKTLRDIAASLVMETED